jgi:tetratricopeptide (TPR) repeat protein
MASTRSQRTGATPAAPTVAAGSSLAAQVMAKAQSGRTVVQDFVPLAESLEWNLGQEYLKERGSKAFLSDYSPVPYVINNSGELSYHCAEVFYTSLVEAEKAGELTADEPIFVLELGIGVGLFARFFLDAIRNLCIRHGKNYYDRLCYVAADRSAQMLRDLLRHGVLSQHAGHYIVRQVDALEPNEWRRKDLLLRNIQTPPLRAVFLNYLLDCLPAAVLELKDDAVNELHVRTVVARGVRLTDYTDLTAEQLQERAKYTDRASYRELLEVYGLFASEYDYRPADLKTLPLADFALELARGKTKHFLHSYGALQCLERLMPLVHRRGFILMNDYGSTSVPMEHPFEHQRFSLATFVGVSFGELLEYYARRRDQYAWVEPGGSEQSIHSRLLMHALPKPDGEKEPEWIVTPEGPLPLDESIPARHRPLYDHDDPTARRFLELFGGGEQSRLQEPVAKARAYVQHGRWELAAAEYREAMDMQPYNWVLFNEAANFMIHHYRGDERRSDPNNPGREVSLAIYGGIKAGIDLAKLALAQNPTSAELWNTLGDGLFAYGRYAEARSAYFKALEVNDQDVRARFNLAFVHIEEKNYPAALEVIAQALPLDKMGQFREGLLRKQQEALALLTRRQQQEYLLLINLVSKHAPTQPSEPPTGPPRRESE